jgi:hypothetical protein
MIATKYILQVFLFKVCFVFCVLQLEVFKDVVNHFYVQNEG